MNVILGIAVLVLTPVVWILYHKIFRVTYFGSVGQSIFKEIAGSFFVSLIIVAIVKVAADSILSGLGSILKILFKVIIVIACITVIVLLIKKITSAKDGSKEKTAVDNGDTNLKKTDTSLHSDDVKTVETVNESELNNKDDQSVEEYIKQNFTKENYVEALKYYREKTNADFNTAKAVVDNLLANR